MSDHQDTFSSTTELASAKLQICLFSTQQQLSNSVIKLLDSDRYELKCLNLVQDLTDFSLENQEQIDCLVLFRDSQLGSVINQLWQSEILLPTLIVELEQLVDALTEAPVDSTTSLPNLTTINPLYHHAEIRLYPTQLAEINSYINLAITKFISFAPGSKISHDSLQDELKKEAVRESLIAQQRRLTEKLKERLGYSGIYYKRNPNFFYRNLSSPKQKKLHHKLSSSYRQIIIEYFNSNSPINKLIDEFVDQAFFADIATSQILEIHMELIDDFSHQLKIEGRNEDILLDCRLPLIDVISHLCEMYRRSIPGANASLELLFTVE
ncbi:MAG TPA: circadian clock protein KaiA [Coleofasciculaceae cyanobacterium]|jgi:circadian clock protein KaiA